MEKRIKRHVIGRQKDFFAATAPGLESLLYNELKSLPGSLSGVTMVQGGVEFRGRLQDCYYANLKLRTANRILMRLTDFKATNFRQLRKKLSSIPWELFLNPDTVPDIHIATRHSRLYHKDVISSHFKEIIEKHLSEIPPRSEEKTGSVDAGIFVRVVDDRFILSIDSSGTLLYKRGIKTHHPKAPIRETIAAAALILAGFDGSQPLVDPMCGSGTFSLEGAFISRNVPPGWFREFAFMKWPAFRPGQWAYMRKEIEKQFKAPQKQPRIFASDIDEIACASLEKILKKTGFSSTIKVFRTDFFDLSPAFISESPGIVTINPPYGLRIGTPEESNTLFGEICKKLKKDYQGWRLALIVPRKDLLKKVPFHLTPHTIHHGGLKVMLLTGIIR